MITALHDLVAWAPLGLPAYLLLMTVIVFFHELGHFSMARACGVKVETFSIGFGPEIVGWNDRHGTRWKISWVPIGGYVKFLGDEDAAGTPDRDAMERMPASERGVAFPFKPLWQRAAVVAAGPFANFILAIVIFALTFMFFGRPVMAPMVGSVQPGSAAEQAGIRSGDMVRAIDGRAIDDFDQLPEIVSLSGGQNLAITLERAGRTFVVHATPRLTATKDPFGDPVNTVLLGISPDVPPVVNGIVAGSPAARAGLRPGDVILSVNKQPVTGFGQFAAIIENAVGQEIAIRAKRGSQTMTVVVRATAPKKIALAHADQTEALGLLSQTYPKVTVDYYGPVGAVGAAVNETWTIVRGTFVYIWQMVTGTSDMSQLRGPVGVAGLAGKIASVGLLALIQLAALMSVSIGLINLFPIPLLDGGHLLYYGCEAVLGRPLGERAQDVGFRVGLAVVLGLMILATWNDLVRLNLF
jgi:regulator of sigma E protease